MIERKEQFIILYEKTGQILTKYCHACAKNHNDFGMFKTFFTLFENFLFIP